MNNGPAKKISIIIPTYNCANTLGACLKSITGQTYKNVEICIVDAASTDGTLGIIKQAAKNFENIKFVSEPDKGIYDAMNKGLDMATGDWVYFSGSDDELSSDDVLTNIFELNKPDADLLYSNIIGMQTNKQFLGNTPALVISDGIIHQSIIYKKYLFQENGKYDARFKIAADYHFTLKIFLNEKYTKRYLDIDIAKYGEQGLSSREYDYTYYSYHYKQIAVNNGVKKITNPAVCLDKSIYCCLFLAKGKKSMFFAWQNLLYYLFNKNQLTLTFKIRTFLRMLRWSLS